MGLTEESMPQWPLSELGERAAEWRALVAEGSVLVVDEAGKPAAVALSPERYDHMARAVAGVSAHLWAAAVDLGEQMGMTSEELAGALGLDDEEFEMCSDLAGISPMSDAGRRAGLLIEVFRLARKRKGRDAVTLWLHGHDPDLGRVPVELMAQHRGLERIRDHLSR